MLLCGLQTNWRETVGSSHGQQTIQGVCVLYWCRPRLRTAVESKSVSTQGRSLFSSRPPVQRIQRKRGFCWQGNWDIYRKVKLDMLEFLCVRIYYILLPSSMVDFVPCDQLVQKAHWVGMDCNSLEKSLADIFQLLAFSIPKYVRADHVLFLSRIQFVLELFCY